MNNMVQLSSLEFYSGTQVEVPVWNDAFHFLALLPCVYISLGNHLGKGCWPVTFSTSPISYSGPSSKFRQSNGFAGWDVREEVPGDTQISASVCPSL